MIAVLIISTYLFMCWLSYRLFIDAWTFEFDADRSDLHFFMFLSAAGPISLLGAIAIWLMDSADARNRYNDRNNEIIYPRKDKS